MKNRVFKLTGGLALATVVFASSFSTAIASSEIVNAPITVKIIGAKQSQKIGGWRIFGPQYYVYTGTNKEVEGATINPVRF